MHLWILRLVFLLLLSSLSSASVDLVPSAASSPAPDALLEAFDTVLQRVVTIRQLEPKEAIQRGVRNRQQIRVLLRELLDDELSPEEWAAERKAMSTWGLLPTDFPLKTFVLDLLTEQAAGYYDPKRRMFFIADWLPPELQQPIMAHELVHALQDQHYGLQDRFGAIKDHADLTLARKALVEGDALAVMLQYMLQPLSLSFQQLPRIEDLLDSGATLFGEQFTLFEQTPPVLKQQLLFPYRYGLTFMKAALAHTGWAGLQQVYRTPPASTEQIIHPEKYFSEAPDHPREVRLQVPERLFQEPWHTLKSDVLGEFLLTIVLQQFLPQDEAQQSAAGWRGDRYQLLEHEASGRLSLICITTWDTPDEAEEFFQSYAKLLGLKYPEWTRLPEANPMAYTWQRNQSRLHLSRQAQTVQIIEGVSASDLPRLRRHLQNVRQASAATHN